MGTAHHVDRVRAVLVEAGRTAAVVLARKRMATVADRRVIAVFLIAMTRGKVSIAIAFGICEY